MPLWIVVWDVLNLEMQCICFAVCGSLGYWHIEHVTNNGVSSLSPATTGYNGRFLGLKNTEHIWSYPFSKLSSQAGLQTTVEICIPSQSFLFTNKKEPVNMSLLPRPQKWLSKPASRMEKLPLFLLPNSVWPNRAYSPFWLHAPESVFGNVVMAENFLSASLHFYAAWLEQISLLKKYLLNTKS